MYADIHLFLATIEAVATKRTIEEEHAYIQGLSRVELMGTHASIMSLFIRCTLLTVLTSTNNSGQCII